MKNRVEYYRHPHIRERLAQYCGGRFDDPSTFTCEYLVGLGEALQKEKDAGISTRYLVLPYCKGSIYLAARIVYAGGDIRKMDGDIKQTLFNIFGNIFGEDVDENSLATLLNTPWELLLPRMSAISYKWDMLKQEILTIDTNT